MDLKQITLFLLFTSIALTAGSSLTYAQPVDGIGTISVPGTMTLGSAQEAPGAISGYIGTIMSVAFGIGLIGLLIYITYGGIQWISAGGDKKGLEGARATITNAVIGIILLSVMYAISVIFGLFIGTETAGPSGPSFGQCTGGGPSGATLCPETPDTGDICPGQNYFYIRGVGRMCPT